MPYIIGTIAVVSVIFVLVMLAFKAAINTSALAQDVREIKILLMEAQNRDKK